MTARVDTDRIAPALLAGWLVGVAGTGAFAFGTAYFDDPEMALEVGLVAAVMGGSAWAVGLALFAGPCWWILHSYGERSPRAAAALGAALAELLPMLVASMPRQPGQGLTNGQLLLAFGAYALLGAAVGLLIWRVAYTNAPAPYWEKVQ